jgi:hypothetical protein
VTAITVVHVSFSASSPSRYNGSIGSGSLFLTLPTRLSTGHIVIASAGEARKPRRVQATSSILLWKGKEFELVFKKVALSKPGHAPSLREASRRSDRGR